MGWWRRPPAPGLLPSPGDPVGRWRLSRTPGRVWSSTYQLEFLTWTTFTTNNKESGSVAVMRRREHPVRNMENSPGPSSHTDTEAGKHYKIEKIDILKAFILPWVTWLLNPSLVVTESLKEDLHDSKSRAFHIKFGLLTTSHFSTGGGEETEIYRKLFCINFVLYWIK